MLRAPEFDLTEKERASIERVLGARLNEKLASDMTLCIECANLSIGIPFYWDSSRQCYFEPSRFHCYGYNHPLAPAFVTCLPQRCERYRRADVEGAAAAHSLFSVQQLRLRVHERSKRVQTK